MDLSTSMTYIATLSVATERITEFIKRIPWVSGYLSTKLPPGTKEDVRVICVHLLAVIVAIVLCYSYPTLAPPELKEGSSLGFFGCLLFGLLASGGSAFWNSALDTFRGVKTKMTPAPAVVAPKN